MNRRTPNPNQSRSNQREVSAGRTGPGIIVSRLTALERTVTELAVDIRFLQRACQPTPSVIFEELCAAIYSAVGRQRFKSYEIFQWAVEELDSNTERVSKAIMVALGQDLTLNAVARLLTRACGSHGPWRLKKKRLNTGNVFTVENLVTKVTDSVTFAPPD